MVLNGVGLAISGVFVLLAVGYYVVIERKLLGIFQRRHGPNKPGFGGLILPVLDAVKVLAKGMRCPYVVRLVVFLGGPLVLFSLCIGVWLIYPVSSPLVYYTRGVCLYLCIVSLNVVGVMACGCCSGRHYGVLGGIRAGAQAVSYEVVLRLVLFCPLLMCNSVELYVVRGARGCYWALLTEVVVMRFICRLAELNRAPFDFVEGESELVSGFMVEYGGVGFMLIVLSEYGMVVFSSALLVSLFVGVGMGFYSDFLFVLISVFVRMVYILVRGALPRYRYDKLMLFCWEKLMPMRAVYFMFCLVLCYLI